jgi:hypothetical protein
MKFDYVDIGTSDFSTSIPFLKEGQTGLYVEPLFHYLAQLPNGSGIIKAPFAISDHKGYGKMYFVSEDNIRRFQLPDWVRGCNSFNRPHQLLSQQLHPSVPVDQLWVPTLTVQDLLDLYEVEQISSLNIDTEGHDHVILQQVIDTVDSLCIQRIKFEYITSNDNIAQLDQLLLIFENMGFSAVRFGDDIQLSRN